LGNLHESLWIAVAMMTVLFGVLSGKSGLLEGNEAPRRIGTGTPSPTLKQPWHKIKKQETKN